MTAGAKGIQIGQPLLDNGQIVLSDGMADLVRDTGAHWVRLHLRLGPFASTDDPGFFDAYDQIIDRVRARGLHIIGLVTYETCAGGQADWIKNNFEKEGGNGYNDYMDRFVRAFEQIVSRYQTKIRYWELWNEPNAWHHDPTTHALPGGTYIYPSNFAAMLTECHARVHFYHQLDVQLVSGGLLGHANDGPNRGSAGAVYLDRVYDTGINKTGKFAWAMNTYGKYPIDIVGQHFYVGADDVQPVFSQYLDWYLEVIDRQDPGTNKSIFVTEYGWPCNLELTGADRDADEAANAQAVLAAGQFFGQQPRVQAACYFNLHDDPGLAFGLLRGDLAARPALQKFRQA